jgi:hypothetical protein
MIRHDYLHLIDFEATPVRFSQRTTWTGEPLVISKAVLFGCMESVPKAREADVRPCSSRGSISNHLSEAYA